MRPLLVLMASAVAATSLRGGAWSLNATTRTGRKPSFMRSWAAAHAKWGKGFPAEAIRAMGAGHGAVDAEPIDHDALYVAEVQLGTPPQTVKLALDTGSADLWVQSTDTAYRVNRKGPWAPKYSPENSSTAERLEDSVWTIRYIDKSNAIGLVYRDILRLGPLPLPSTLIESAASISAQFERETRYTGVMGLAKNVSNGIDPPQPAFLASLATLLDRPVFSADLRTASTSRFDFGSAAAGGDTGTRTGASSGTSAASSGAGAAAKSRTGGGSGSNGADAKSGIGASTGANSGTTGTSTTGTSTTPHITWMQPNASHPHWTVRLDRVSWKGAKSDNTDWSAFDFEAVVDTGTSLLFLPDDLATKYWTRVPGVVAADEMYQSYQFPCNVSLPDLLFKLPASDGTSGSDIVLTVPGAYLNYGPSLVDDSLCWGGMQSSRQLNDQNIIGDVMLKAVIVAFDMEKGRVGFANKKLDP